MNPRHERKASPQPGFHCDVCGKRLYLVQNRLGQRFYVAHDGTRWCR